MKDSSDHNVDPISDQIKSTRNKTRRMKSSNKIYERFVKRVEAIGNKEKSKDHSTEKNASSSQTFHNEALDLEELSIWDYSDTSAADLEDYHVTDAIKQTTINDTLISSNTSMDIGVARSNHHDRIVDTRAAVEETLPPKKQNKLEQGNKTNGSSRKNLIIIAVILVSLISTIMLVVASGKLSDLNNSATEAPIINTEPALKEERVNPPADSDTVSTDEPAAIASAVSVSVSVSESKSVAKLEPTISANHLDMEHTTDTIIKKEEAVIENEEVVENVNPEQNLEELITSDKEQNQALGISIEDFKQESQSTLYRE